MARRPELRWDVSSGQPAPDPVDDALDHPAVLGERPPPRPSEDGNNGSRRAHCVSVSTAQHPLIISQPEQAELHRVLRGQLVVGWVMGSGWWGWIVPEGLWEIAGPLLPSARVRPQGGGVSNIDDEAVFAAIVYVLVSGCAWWALPPCFGASKSTVHRRFLIWSRAGVWGRLHQKVLEMLAGQGLVDLSRAVLDSAHVRAKKRGQTYRPVARGPGQAGFEDARPVGCERTAPTRGPLRGEHPRQPRTEANGRPFPHRTRIPQRPFQTPAAARRQ
ncbi:Putative transposase of IS4/5 family [Streptomyces sp. MnatMP-M27]|nr:Putative transposase of IS4/5 family [Streptomyces sp. MnatMP-M27]